MIRSAAVGVVTRLDVSFRGWDGAARASYVPFMGFCSQTASPPLGDIRAFLITTLVVDVNFRIVEITDVLDIFAMEVLGDEKPFWVAI